MTNVPDYPQYVFTVKTLDNLPVAVFTEYRALSWQKKVNASGFFNFIIDGEDDKRDIFEINRKVQIFRSESPDTPIFTGIINKIVLTWFSNDNSQILVTGTSLTGLLERRSIAYLETSPQANKSDFSQNAMFEYCKENIGTLATSPPRLFEGIMGRVEVQFANGMNGGSLWEGDKSEENLLSVCQDIAGFSDEQGTPTDFEVVEDNTQTKFLVKIYNGITGLDKTRRDIEPFSITNPAGNIPVVFSRHFGNITRESSTLSGEEVNVIFVSGAGEDLDNIVEVVIDIDLIDAERINQKERFVNGTDTTNTAILNSEGIEWLSELQAQTSISFSPRQTATSRYGIDWDVGDLITIITTDSRELHKRIISVTTNISSEYVEGLNIVFGDINA